MRIKRFVIYYVLQSVLNFSFIGNSYEGKTLREDAHDAQAENVALRLRVSARVRKQTLYS